MKPSILLAMAVALDGAFDSPFRVSEFNGNCRCKNCGKSTFKSDVCDLRCLSQWKAKQKQEEK